MWARLGTIVESEHGFDDGFELLGYLNDALPAAVGSTRVFVAFQLDAEGLAKLGHGPRENDRSPRRMLQDDAEPVRARERPHRGQIRGTRFMRRCKGLAYKRRALPLTRSCA